MTEYSQKLRDDQTMAEYLQSLDDQQLKALFIQAEQFAVSGVTGNTGFRALTLQYTGKDTIQQLLMVQGMVNRECAARWIKRMVSDD